MSRLLAWLLYLANADPFLFTREFYSVKDRILNRWGARRCIVGPDFKAREVTRVQEITKECHGCEGAGIYPDSKRLCQRCYGSGIYTRFWVILEVWTIGGREFLRPREKTWTKPAAGVNILGRVRHKSHGRASQEALLWLFLLFDLRTFARAMRCSIGHGWYFYPMKNIQRLIWYVRVPLRWVMRCQRCGRLTIREPGWVVCRKCEGESIEEVPF